MKIECVSIWEKSTFVPWNRDVLSFCSLLFFFYGHSYMGEPQTINLLRYFFLIIMKDIDGAAR